MTTIKETKGVSFVKMGGAQEEMDRIIKQGFIVFGVTPYVSPDYLTMACITYGYHRFVVAGGKEGSCATGTCS